MRGPKAQPVTAPAVSRFRRVFPRLSAIGDVVVLAGMVVKAFGQFLVACWWHRADLVLVALAALTWYGLSELFDSLRTGGVVLLVAIGVGVGLWWVKPLRLWAVIVLRRRRAGRILLWVAGSVARGRSRRLLIAGLKELRTANSSGKLPIVMWTATTGVGERMTVHCRAGQSAELLDLRAEELRAAAKSRDVRITRDPNRSHRVIVDVVRRDPLAATANIPWADVDADVLSMWDPIHLGTDENGTDVRLALPERSLFSAGEPGAGKSSLMNLVVAHAAKSPDAHMVLIDPNDVQFGPWQDRALAYASDSPAEALEALELVRAEIDRRKRLFRTMPGVVRKITRRIAEDYDLPLWLVGIDELAYHTSVVGKPTGAFATAARDVVARGRAFGMIPMFGTQRPTSDVVPTSLRDLFSIRLAFRCTTQASSDVILGEGWARRGYSATDIDINNRGVGWLLAEGTLPRRIKGGWVSDDTIGDLSVSTIRHRPGLTIPALAPIASEDATS